MSADLWEDQAPDEKGAGRRRSTAAIRILYLEENPNFVAELISELRERKFWHVIPAGNAEQARALARQHPIDVLLLSATMPEIDPIEVAEELTLLYPRLTTFILAPDAESGGAFSYASGRFQWLPKPCNPAALVSSVERMASLADWLTSNSTIELVAGLHSLPAIPSNYQSVIRTIQSPDSTTQEIGDAIGKDMGITARALQLANSAYYGYGEKISNTTEAARVLGVKTLICLVRYTHVLNSFPPSPDSNALFDQIWRHSMNVAIIARKIALRHTRDEKLAEEAFTAGLLHDIGKLVLISLKPAELKEVSRAANEGKSPPHLIERIKLGTTHAETGAYLLCLWGIPLGILEAVAWHHFPGESAEKKFSALTAVHVANVAEHRRVPAANEKPPELDRRYLALIGLDKEPDDWLNLTPEDSKMDLPPPVTAEPAPSVTKTGFWRKPWR